MSTLKNLLLAFARRIPTDGQELLGLTILIAGLWIWWRPAALIVLGALLVASALLKATAADKTDDQP